MHSYRSADEIARLIIDRSARELASVLAVVLETDGSTPTRVGAQALLDTSGLIAGTIGGGSVEAAVIQRAASTLAFGRPVTIDFGLSGREMDSSAPICGGSMRVLLDPTVNDRHLVYQTVVAARRRRERGLLLTSMSGDRHHNVAAEYVPESAIIGQVGPLDPQRMLTILDREEPANLVQAPTPDNERCEVLVEPIVAAPLLLIAGGGHVGQAVATQADLVGFEVVVLDDRHAFTRPELYPVGTTLRTGSVGDELLRYPLGQDTYIVIVTRGHEMDAEVLAACIHKPSAYIGMIGSRRKVTMMRKEFIETGQCTASEFDRVYTPIGLDIGSVTVQEIAFSITAQLIAVRRNKCSPKMPAGQGSS